MPIIDTKYIPIDTVSLALDSNLSAAMTIQAMNTDKTMWQIVYDGSDLDALYN
jgi:hypothetical protein